MPSDPQTSKRGTRVAGDAANVGGDPSPILEARGLVKRFGEVLAVDGVDLDIRRSQVLALLGQNGAGKSTLIKMIGGFVEPDEGTIRVNGYDLGSGTERRQSRVATVAQELSIVPTATVAENVFLGSRRRGLWQQRRLAREAAPFLRRIGLDEIDPLVPAGRLTVAQAQLVEIARVLARDAQAVIFDEPTASLSDSEIARVESVVRDLAAEGRAVIYVTHRLGEVMRFCDSVLVLRNGSAVANVPVASTPLDEIVTYMLGRPLESLFPDSASSVGDAVLKATELSGPGLLEAMDVEIRAGEITGLAGQLGAGNTAVLRLIAGFDKPASGTITVDNRPVRAGSPAAAVRAGIVYCTDDRKRDGFFAERPLIENLSALSLDALSEGPWMIRRREREFATEAARFLGIDERRMRASVSALSGGNQQKVVLGKLACRQPPPRVLLMNEPTRGVDVGARADIYQLIRKLADDGMAVAFASSDISEMMGLADRVVTFFRGRPVSVLSGAGLDERRVILDVTHPRDSVK